MMKKTVIYALDFDGVICDSAIETGISAWKAAIQLWDDMTEPLPSQQLLTQFRQIRPMMGTGYEAILIIRLLHHGETVKAIMDDYPAKKQSIMSASQLNIDALKKLFGETRDRWIEQDLNDWITMNPLFPEMANKLQNLSQQGLWYIITTKQERFVKQILKANQVSIEDERIFGLDRHKSKETILLELVNQHTEATIYFVEDMLPMLLKVINNQSLASVKLFFALWGYNTDEDKLSAKKQALEWINLDDFLVQNH